MKCGRLRWATPGAAVMAWGTPALAQYPTKPRGRGQHERAEFNGFIKSETVKWAKVVKEAGIRGSKNVALSPGTRG